MIPDSEAPCRKTSSRAGRGRRRVHAREREALRPHRPRGDPVPQPDVRRLQQPRLVEAVRLEGAQAPSRRDDRALSGGAERHAPSAPRPPHQLVRHLRREVGRGRPSCRRRSTGRCPGRTPAPRLELEPNRLPLPLQPQLRRREATPVRREELLEAHRVEPPPRRVEPCQDLPHETLPRQRPAPAPRPLSPVRRPVNSSFTRTRSARTSCCREPSKRTGVISTTALFLSPWNTVSARRASSGGRSPGEEPRRHANAGRRAPCRPGTPPSPPCPAPRDEGPGSCKLEAPPPSELDPPADHRVHERPAQGQRRGLRVLREVEARARRRAPSPEASCSVQKPPVFSSSVAATRRARGRCSETASGSPWGVQVGETASGAAARTHGGAGQRDRLSFTAFRAVSAPVVTAASAGGDARRHRGDRPVERRPRRRVHVLQAVVVARPVHETVSRQEYAWPTGDEPRPGIRDDVSRVHGPSPRARGRRGSRDCRAPNPSATRGVPPGPGRLPRRTGARPLWAPAC